ncbi:hypothetical protein [Streptococcus danieliae]
MKKQRNKKLIRIFLLLLATSIYIFTNLSWHQIYYYTHSQKTDKRLTPIIVVYNLGEIMFKPKRETDGKYEYVSPGNAINYNESDSFSYSFKSGSEISTLNTSVGLYSHNDDIQLAFQLDPNLKITNIYKYSPDDITEEKPTPEDQAIIDRYVKQLTDHVLETRVTPPIFNLQWLYDLTFNEKKVLHLDDE